MSIEPKWLQMRKKFVVILFAVIAALSVLYGVWWTFPKAKNAEVVAEAHRVTQERLERIRSQAEDPEVNGFLNPTFLPYWGRMGIEQKESSRAREKAQSTVRHDLHGTFRKIKPKNHQ